MAERPARPARGESLPRQHRLRRRRDYLSCYRHGRRRHGSLLILYVHPNREGHPRLGITASRKVGRAVVRHRLKRRAREIYRRWQGRSSLPAVDLVVHFKPPAGSAGFGSIESELERLLAGLGPKPGREA